MACQFAKDRVSHVEDDALATQMWEAFVKSGAQCNEVQKLFAQQAGSARLCGQIWRGYHDEGNFVMVTPPYSDPPAADSVPLPSFLHQDTSKKRRSMPIPGPPSKKRSAAPVRVGSPHHLYLVGEKLRCSNADCHLDGSKKNRYLYEKGQRSICPIKRKAVEKQQGVRTCGGGFSGLVRAPFRLGLRCGLGFSSEEAAAQGSRHRAQVV